MTISSSDNGTPPDVLADARLIAEYVAAGKPIPPEVVQRVQQRAEKIRQRVFAEQGLVDIAVPAIRELRGELPE